MLFRSGIVEQMRGLLIGLGRRCVDDAGARLEMGKRRLGDPKHRMDVRLERGVKRLGGQVEDRGDGLLPGGIVHKNIQAAEFADGRVDKFFAERLIPNISRQRHRLPPRMRMS